jgi:hypothetical protein
VEEMDEKEERATNSGHPSVDRGWKYAHRLHMGAVSAL